MKNQIRLKRIWLKDWDVECETRNKKIKKKCKKKRMSCLRAWISSK